jgi:hypothetical protein
MRLIQLKSIFNSLDVHLIVHRLLKEEQNNRQQKRHLKQNQNLQRRYTTTQAYYHNCNRKFVHQAILNKRLSDTPSNEHSTVQSICSPKPDKANIMISSPTPQNVQKVELYNCPSMWQAKCNAFILSSPNPSFAAPPKYQIMYSILMVVPSTTLPWPVNSQYG